MSEQRFPRQYRIRLNKDFDRVFRERNTAANQRIIVFACQNELGFSRLGISVPRKIRGAVRRNRWKRLIREAFRLSRAELPAGLDLIVVPRPEVEPELAGLQESLRHLARRIARRLHGPRRKPRRPRRRGPSNDRRQQPQRPQ